MLETGISVVGGNTCYLFNNSFSVIQLMDDVRYSRPFMPIYLHATKSYLSTFVNLFAVCFQLTGSMTCFLHPVPPV
jgi:hypothetical protein